MVNIAVIVGGIAAALTIGMVIGYIIIGQNTTNVTNIVEEDIAFTSALGAYLATKKANATLELAEVRKVIIGNESRNEPYYYSYWVVLKDSPYKSLEDLRGKKVAFANPIDPSSYLMPLASLKETNTKEHLTSLNKALEIIGLKFTEVIR